VLDEIQERASDIYDFAADQVSKGGSQLSKQKLAEASTGVLRVA
jgi:hypothetical protein